MPDPDIGPVRGIADAMWAIEGHLKLWLALYLNRQQTHLNAAKPDDIPPVDLRMPRSWRTPITAAPGNPIVNDGQLPAVSVVPAGTGAGQVRRNGLVWEASWLVDVVIFARGSGYDHTAAVLGGYMTAVHTALAQHRGVGDLDDCHWLAEQLESIDPRQARTLGMASVSFRALYERAVDEREAPAEPPDPVTDPVPDWPVVETPIVTIERNT